MDKETEVWFAMRATYRRELEAMHLLEKANLGCFIPCLLYTSDAADE